VLHAIIRMENQGWKLLDRNFSYNGGSGHGIDLVFTRQDKGVTRYGIVEAKAGTSLRPDGTIKLDNARTAAGNAMQGSREYNADRLNRFLGQSNPSSDSAMFARSLIQAYDVNQVENFASLARSDRLLSIDDAVRTRADMRHPGSHSPLNWVNLRRA
jgi:hypothetical protein